MLSAADSLLKAAPSPTAHESSQSFSEDGTDAVHQGGMNGTAAAANSSAYSQHPTTAVPFDAQEHTDALKEIWGQLLAQQRLNGQLAGHSGQSASSNTSQDAAADDARQDAGSDTRSTDSSPDPSTTAHEQPPKTPSTTHADTLYNSSALHATSGYASETVNPLWSPRSNVESVSSPITPQVTANQSSGWHAGTAELEDSEATTAEQSGSGFEAPQPTAHSVSASQDGGENLLDTVQHEPASSRLEHRADELDAGQPSARSNGTNTDMASPAEQQSEAPSSDIYEAAQTRLNKDAAEAYFRKGQEAVQQRDWSKAVSLCSVRSCLQHKLKTEMQMSMLQSGHCCIDHTMQQCRIAPMRLLI